MEKKGGVPMEPEQRIAMWKAEEEIAYIHGWDFSHIEDRYRGAENLPWNYRQAIQNILKPEMKLLDLDTGGGEFLLSLGHPLENTAATENYPPNVQLCRNTLLPMGIDFRPADAGKQLPFREKSFDLVIDRHGDFCAAEIFRVLKPGGWFVTQQVGADNDRELTQLLCGDVPKPYPDQYLSIAEKQFREAGFEITDGQEAYRPITFFDVGALVWFARIISWEFPGFAVDTHKEGLWKAQAVLEQKGCITGSTHRFFLVARKPEQK